jgi:hypothetical protein
MIIMLLFATDEHVVEFPVQFPPVLGAIPGVSPELMVKGGDAVGIKEGPGEEGPGEDGPGVEGRGDKAGEGVGAGGGRVGCANVEEKFQEKIEYV